MANFQIAFDNHNLNLGYYFEESKKDIVAYINQACQNPLITEIPSPKCNQAYIDICIPQVNQNNFLFIAYSHGEPHRLIANGVLYVDLQLNAHLFVNSFFYSMSCHTGKALGPNLVNNHNCHAFIGYNDLAWILNGAYFQLSIDCDNYGLKQFISGAVLGDAFENMKKNFTIQIDILEQQGEIIFAGLLRKNRDALVFFGNKNLHFCSF